MFLIYLIVAIIITLIADHSISSIIAIIFVTFITYEYTLIICSKQQKRGRILWFYSNLIFLISAIIFSSCFTTTDYFLTSDPIRYIDTVTHVTSMTGWQEEFYKCYVLMTDNNGLYNMSLRLLGFLGNQYFGGVTVLYITLFHSMFGILTVSTLYKILSKYIDDILSFRYALYYSIFSVLLFYSSVILRDIVIAYYFALTFLIIINNYSHKYLLLLILIMLCVWGTRLYTGYFYSAFILVYIYKASQGKLITKDFTIVISIIIICIVASSALFNSMKEQSIGEIMVYDEYASDFADKTEGLSGKIIKLPSGVKQIASLMYSQCNPFPPYTAILSIENIRQLFMALTLFVASIAWFFISYTLFYYLIFKKGGKNFSQIELFLLCISIVFILLCTVHMDIRRMLPVYPIIYLLYLKTKHFLLTQKQLKAIQLKLGVVYCLLILTYNIIKI